MSKSSQYMPEVNRLVGTDKADGVLLIVVGGKRGNGICSKVRVGEMPMMAAILRHIAEDMEKGYEEATGEKPDPVSLDFEGLKRGLADATDGVQH